MVQDRSIVSAMEKLPMRVLHIVLTVCFNCMAGMLLADAPVLILFLRRDKLRLLAKLRITDFENLWTYFKFVKVVI